MKNLHIIIVGGGITGCSLAYALTKKGATRVSLLEKSRLTDGTTFHSVGLVTQWRSNAALMELMRMSVSCYVALKEEDSELAGWYPAGSIRLASSTERAHFLKRKLASIPPWLKARWVEPGEIAEKVPVLNLDGVQGGIWIDDDGYAEPEMLAHAFIKRAKRQGANVLEDTQVIDILPRTGGGYLLDTNNGSFEADVVLLAAGMWTPLLAEMAGYVVPMVPLLHQHRILKDMPCSTDGWPVLRDPDNQFYCRPGAAGLYVGGFGPDVQHWAPDGVPWSFQRSLLTPDDNTFHTVWEGACERLPDLGKATDYEQVHGPDAVTPDGLYALGPLNRTADLWVAAGMSFNGIAGAGGVGQYLSDWMLEGRDSLPFSPESIDVARFKKQSTNQDDVIQKASKIYTSYYALSSS